MAEEARCPNPGCRRTSRLGQDALGRTFRCPHCRTKLAKPAAVAATAFAATLDRPVPRAAWGDAPRPEGRSGESTAGRPVPTTATATAEAAPRVGRFEVLGTLGAGASARVYRAFDPGLRREVALKVLDDGAPEGSRASARFLAEARAMARLAHPRIVAIHEAGRDGGRYYIASALVEGPSLARVLEAGPLDARSSARVAADVAEALAYAHGRGVVHRDVKPGNVLIDADGAAHLSDFGLAHRHDAAERLTLDGAVLGTPAYVAPEQAGGGAGPLPASDQYGLGAVLFEMLCGRPPFVGPPLMVLFQAVHQDPPSPRSIRPDVPRRLEAICLRALAKRPEDRYADCRALADDLTRWLEGEPIATGPGDRPGRRRGRGRRLGPAAGMALVAFGLLAATVAVTVRSLASAPSATAPREPSPSPGSPREAPRSPTPLPARPEVAAARP